MFAQVSLYARSRDHVPADICRAGIQAAERRVAGSQKEGSFVSRRILVVAFTAMISAALFAACGVVDRQAADDANDEPATEVDDTDDAVTDEAADDADADLQQIDVNLSDHQIDMDSSASSGEIEFNVTNDGDVPHGIAIQEGTDGEGDFLYSLSLDPGASGTLEVSLEHGEYTIFCPMANHRDEHGMELEFTVGDDEAVTDDDDDAVVGDTHEVILTDFEIDMPAEIAAGDITFEVSNEGDSRHGIAIEDQEGELLGATTLVPGESGTVEVTLEAGTYIIYDPIGEHRDDHDMEVELTVTDEDAVTDDEDDAVTGDTFEVALSDHEIDMPEEVPAGDITFEVSNEGDGPHGIAIEDEDGEMLGATTVHGGESSTLDVTLEAGTYTVFCPIGEHREDHDMEVELTVTEDDDAVTDDDDDEVAEDTFEVVLSDHEIDMPEEVSAGDITFEVANEGDSRHGLAFQEIDEDGDPGDFVASITISDGESDTLEATLETGEYIVFCPIGEHRDEHGMEVELTVE